MIDVSGLETFPMGLTGCAMRRKISTPLLCQLRRRTREWGGGGGGAPTMPCRHGHRAPRKRNVLQITCSYFFVIITHNELSAFSLSSCPRLTNLPVNLSVCTYMFRGVNCSAATFRDSTAFQRPVVSIPCPDYLPSSPPVPRSGHLQPDVAIKQSESSCALDRCSGSNRSRYGKSPPKWTPGKAGAQAGSMNFEG